MNLTAKNFNKQYLPFIEELLNCLEQKNQIIRRIALKKIVEFKNTMRLYKSLKGNNFENIVEIFEQLSLDDARTLGDKLENQDGLCFSDIEQIGSFE